MNKPELELLFRMYLTGHPHDLGHTPYGRRRFVQVTGGNFEGRQMKGEVLAVGTDNAIVRRDGVFEPNVNLVLRTHDQALIHVTYHGQFWASEEILAKLLIRELGVDPSSYYLRNAVFFETSAEPYLWLNRTMAVSTGEPAPITEKGSE